MYRPTKSYSLLPLDPDAAAKGPSTVYLERFGCDVGVLIADTAGEGRGMD